MEGRSFKQPEPPIQQAGVVPFRWNDQRLEFCLITGRRSGRWGFPKGQIGPQDSIVSAALSEAREEAGLLGAIVGTQLGQFAYRKKGRCFDVVMLLMRVDAVQEAWKESRDRARIWATVTEARVLIDRPHLDQLLVLASERLHSGRSANPSMPVIPTTGFAPFGFDPQSQIQD